MTAMKPEVLKEIEESRHCIWCEYYRLPKDRGKCAHCIHETMYNEDQDKRRPHWVLAKTKRVKPITKRVKPITERIRA